MSAAPFLRLGLLAASAGYVVGLFAAAEHVSVVAAVVAACVAPVLAAFVTLEHDRSASVTRPGRRRRRDASTFEEIP